MSIAVFSNFVNGIPTTIYDGKDVSMVMLVDPPANLPNFFLANKGVLDTASKTIKVYDDTGNTVIHDFDIAGTDLTPITEAIASLETRVGDNESDIAALQIDVAGNAADISTNTSDIGSLQGRTSDLESITSKHTTDIIALQSSTGSNASDISALTLRVGTNETNIAAVLLTANAADSLSKQNKDRLDNLPPPPSLEGYIKTGDDATLNSVSFGDNTKIDTQPDLGLVLQGDYIYGKADSGLEHFFVESGNFNVKSKKIQKVNDGQAEDDAVNKRQLGAVESKADSAQSTADAADSLSKANQVAIGNLSTTVGENSAGISTNAKSIGDLETKVDEVETTANAADTLSKNNEQRLNNLPEGGGLKPTNNTWEMLDYPVLNIGTSTEQTSAATVGQVNTVDSKAEQNTTDISSLGATVGQLDTQVRTNTADISTVTTTANAADVLSKDNKDKLDNLPAPPDLDGYVKNGEDVNFGTAAINVVKVTKGSDNTKFSDILIDGNTNTQMNFVGDTHFYVRDKSDNSKSLEAFQIDSSARLVAKQKIKTPVITNLESGTTNSNSDKAGFIDLSVTNEVKLGAKSKVTISVAGNPLADFTATGTNFNNNNITNVKHLLANSTGTMNIAGVKLIKRDDTKDTNQSIQINSGDITSYSDKHEWKTNDGARRLTIENHIADWHDCKLSNVNDAVANKDVPNLAQVNALISAGGGGSPEEWFEVARGDLASNGTRPTGASSDNKLNIWHTSVGESTTSPSNEFKINYAGAYGKVAGWSSTLRYKLVQGGKVQYWVAPDNGWETSSTVWHLSGDKVSGDDLTLGVETVVYASPHFMSGSGSFQKYIATSTAATYYEHQGDSHLYIDWTGNGGTISLDTMRSGTEQQEDLFMLHNKTNTEMSVRFFFNGSSVTQAVAGNSFIQGWTNRDLGKWVLGVYKDPSFVPEQLVIKADDLSWTTASDPRLNTKRLIEAAPTTCTIIGRHIANGNAKQKIISIGDTSKVESQTSTFVINKHSTGHATGICTSEESSGKTWSRILDGKRGAWFTNESANSRMVSVDIDPTEYPENQIFFTTDQGIMETYFDEANDEVKLRTLEGYNVPKNEQDIAALEIQTEKNRSQTHYFINEGSLSYDWPDESRRPLVEVQVLNTMQTINNSSVTVTDNDTHRYSGTYNTVGTVAINSSGNWAVQYVYHNAYKKTDQDWYVVFNQGNATWQIIEAANPHTSVGSVAASVTVQLGGQTSLPESFGNYTIDPDFDNIDSLEFITAEVPVQYDDINSRVLINFNGAKPSGYVVLK